MSILKEPSDPAHFQAAGGFEDGGEGVAGTRQKNGWVLIIDKQQVMSERKIVRLKTPGKNGQEGRSSEETRVESEEFNQESTILLVKSVACSEELQVTLINEINKVYKELSKLRLTADSYEQENRTLKSRLESAQRESKGQKEQYQLERDNHRRLRKFYEAREQEWVSIVNEHRRILEQCQRAPSSGAPEDQYSQLESMYTNLEQMLSNKDGKEAREGRRLTRGQQDREDSLSPKFQLNLQAQRDKDHSRDTSQTRIDLKQASSSLRPKRQLQGRLTEMTPPKQNDERTPPKLANGLLESMLRRTYERYRQKGLNSWDIQQLEDMIKLKNAKTSTKERLAKTIRKLDFPVNNESEIKNLCECIEKAVVDRYKALRGDFAFDFLAQRFKNYESITQSDMHQSQIVRGQASTVRNIRITELPLESAIKDDKSRKQIIRKSLESSIRGHTPRKRPSDSGEQERMHQSHVFNRVLQPGDDLSRK